MFQSCAPGVGSPQFQHRQRHGPTQSAHEPFRHAARRQAGAKFATAPALLPDLARPAAGARPASRSDFAPIAPAPTSAGTDNAARLARPQAVGCGRPAVAFYPATDMPGIWHALQPHLRHTPTLDRTLQRLAAEGWTVNGSPGGHHYMIPELRQIHIDSAQPPAAMLQKLAHETQHAADRLQPARRFASDLEYADYYLESEVNAVMNQMQVRQEIASRTGWDTGLDCPNAEYFEAALQLYQQHGDEARLRKQFKDMIAFEPIGPGGACYLQHYRNGWRAVHGHAPGGIPAGLASAMQAQAMQKLAFEWARTGAGAAMHRGANSRW